MKRQEKAEKRHGVKISVEALYKTLTKTSLNLEVVPDQETSVKQTLMRVRKTLTAV